MLVTLVSPHRSAMVRQVRPELRQKSQQFLGPRMAGPNPRIQDPGPPLNLQINIPPKYVSMIGTSIYSQFTKTCPQKYALVPERTLYTLLIFPPNRCELAHTHEKDLRRVAMSSLG